MNSTFDSYTAALDGLAFSSEAKARMTERIAAATRSDGHEAVAAAAPVIDLAAERAVAAPAARPRRRLGRAVAAAAIVAALGLGAGTVAVASGVMPLPSDALSDIFGSAPAETELIDSIGHPIGASASSNGVTVTADSVIGDETSYTVVFTVSRDDGRPFEGVTGNGDGRLHLMAPGSSLRVDGVRAAGGSAYFYDADPTDNAIQYVEQMSTDTDGGTGIVGRTARFSMGDISALNEDGTLTPVATGDWNLKFKMNYADTGVDLPAGQTVGWGGTTAKVDGLTVSSVGATVRYTVDGEMRTPAESGRVSDAQQAEMDRYLGMPILVTFSDGTTEDLTDTGTSARSSDGSTHITKAGQFGRVASVDDIVSVTLGDTVVTVNG